jgi:hypothetical protein
LELFGLGGLVGYFGGRKALGLLEMEKYGRRVFLGKFLGIYNIVYFFDTLSDKQITKSNNKTILFL